MPAVTQVPLNRNEADTGAFATPFATDFSDSEGEIDPTDLFVPFDQIDARLSELPSPESKIVLHCRSGSMSGIAARALVGAGYTNVRNLDGGMNAWRAQGHAIEERPQN